MLGSPIAEGLFLSQSRFLRQSSTGGLIHMPAIGTVPPRLHRQGPSLIDTTGKWVGSKLGKRNDLVTIDANGRYDQLVAVSTAYNSTTARFAALGQNIKSTVLVDAACMVEKFDDNNEIYLPCMTAAGAAKATTLAMKGKLFPGFRDSAGNYGVNTDSNTNPVWECLGLSPEHSVGEVGGMLRLRAIAGSRLL